MQHSDIFSFNGITNKEEIEKDIDQNKDKAQDIIYEEIDSLNIKILDNEVYEHNIKIINKYQEKYPEYQDVYNNKNIDSLIKILKRKLYDNDKYFKRLYKEFDLILKFNFENVFYQVYEILKLSDGIPHIIRGSAGSCLLCYLMAITNIDPIQESIALSRFMHRDRQDIPDIDIDFPSNRRDEIYKKIFTKWKNKVARISNHIMFKEKSAFREAIRNQGYRKFVPREYNLNDIFDDKDTIKKVNEDAKNLIGGFRCYSLHCGGIVIFPSNVPENLVLRDYEIDKTGFKGTQIWMNKDQVEDADMIKIDVLSNRGLSQLWDISHTPIIEYNLNDEKTLDIFRQGNNIGLTHSESRAMMKVFKTMQPRTIKEIAIALALIRPAASKNYQKADFLKDYTPYKYNSNKYVIFDDDATLYIRNLLKCDESVADNYRRAFSKNKKYKKLEFIDKMKSIILDKNERDIVISRLEQLEYYSFCKSHAFSYAQLVVGLAYHKAHNSKIFWLSTLNNCNSSYRKWVHYREAVKSGLIIIPGKKPFKKSGNVLIPAKAEISEYKKSSEQLLNYGYFVTKEFIPGMYYEEYWTKQTARHKNLDKLIIQDKQIKYAKFKGIIVTGRGYKKDDGKGYITFVTIASDDCIYHDLVLYGYHKISKMLCLSGYGKIKTDGFVTWIDVMKWKSEWI
jgi:DNA polymerase III alpha subunit